MCSAVTTSILSQSSMASKVLWLDDLRPVPQDTSEEYEWVKNFYEFQKWIVENGMPDVLDLDHDLGGDKTGYDCLKFCLGMHSADKTQKLPELRIHSSNPVGSENMLYYYRNYSKVL